MANGHSPSNSRRLREQRAQQGAVMRGYSQALRTAYSAEPLPQHMQRLLEQLEKQERR